MRNDLLRAVIGQRQDRTALGHHGACAPGHRDQRIGGNVHRHQEVVEAGVDIFPAQFALVRKADRVNDEVDGVPARLERIEGGVERIHVRYVALDQEIAAHLFRQRADALLERFALVGKGQFRPMLRQLPGDAPCQRLVVGEPHDQPALTCHQPAHAACSSSSISRARAARRPSSVSSVWLSSSSGVSASAAFSSAPITTPSPTSQKKNRTIITPASPP